MNPAPDAASSTGSEPQADDRPRHHLGWQITGRCNRRCPYCLRLRQDKPASELGAAACARILDAYLDFVQRSGFVAGIMYSGGNPLLRPDLPQLLRRTAEARSAGLVEHVSMLANPETVDDAMAGLLGECIDSITISIDGRPEGNDRMRGPGSHAAAVAAIPRLVAVGLRVGVKFTLSRHNLLDAPYVLDLARSLGAVSVGIGIMSRPDGAGDLSDMLIGPDDYRRHLIGMVAYDDLADEGRRRFARRSQRLQRGLQALLYHELGRYEEFLRRSGDPDEEPFSGFGTRRARQPAAMRGRNMFVVWEDGSVHASNPQAHPILGMVPQESFLGIHERRLRSGDCLPVFPLRRDPYAEPASAVCRDCPVRAHCAGDSPHCWRLHAAA